MYCLGVATGCGEAEWWSGNISGLGVMTACDEAGGWSRYMYSLGVATVVSPHTTRRVRIAMRKMKRCILKGDFSIWRNQHVS